MVNAKFKIAIVISDNMFVRNYITTNAFSEIENKYQCNYLFSEKIVLKDIKSEGDFFSYLINKKNHVLHLKIFNLLMWKYQNLSSSFKFRVMRLMQLDMNFPAKDSLFVRTIKVPIRLARWLKMQCFFRILASRFISPIIVYFYRKKLVDNHDLRRKLEIIKPDLIIFPSSAFDPDGNDLLILSRKMGVPTLFLIDNWDNLSSKSIFWIKPTKIGVWGQQSLQHAIDIQGFNPLQVACIGTPRYDQYFKLRNNKLENHFDFKYILFVGTALSFDEISVLRRLELIIKNNSDLFGATKIVYRPHPWRQGYDRVCSSQFDHIIIDPQINETYLQQSFSANNQPNLSYYPSLIRNAEFVIGGLTSMLIEALIFKKRYLALVHNDGKNLTSQHNAYKYFMHFQGLSEIDEITFCHQLYDFEKLFIETWNKRKETDMTLLDKKRRHFYYDDDLSYAERLLKLCNEIVVENDCEIVE